MKKILLLTVIFSTFLFAQIDTTSLDYFPMAIGNIWKYHVNLFSPSEESITTKTFEIIGDSLINNKMYFTITGQWENSDQIERCYFRIDSSTSTVYNYDTSYSKENEFFRLNANVGDTVIHQVDNRDMSFICKNIRISYYFDTKIYITRKHFEYYVGLDQIGYEFAKYFGLIEFYKYHWIPETSVTGIVMRLIYAKIDGNEYIMSTVGTDGFENQLSTFKLFQNYPNPFNSSTMIRFILAYPENVILNIFNVSGKLIESIRVNVENSQDYSYLWDARKYSSGIYIYQVKGSTFQQSRKCLFIK